jgi:hypothetical protein
LNQTKSQNVAWKAESLCRNKKLGAQQIVTKLRQVEVLQSQGKSVAAAFKEVGLGATEPDRNWVKRC